MSELQASILAVFGAEPLHRQPTVTVAILPPITSTERMTPAELLDVYDPDGLWRTAIIGVEPLS